MKNMENYIYFKLVHKDENDVELVGCIDLYTIDDDELDMEYRGNDGVWNPSAPHYCKIDGTDYTFELEQLKEVKAVEWSHIRQLLVDCADLEGVDDITFKKEFDVCTLYISYDEEFGGNRKNAIQIHIKLEDDFEENYMGNLNVTHNGKLIEDAEILKELGEELKFDDDDEVTITSSSIYMQMPKTFSKYIDEDYQGQNPEIINEWIETCKEYFARK